jgi:hypothetical protein
MVRLFAGFSYFLSIHKDSNAFFAFRQDEADILGDRIAIMADGQLRCVGSPLFLKRSYGVGYQLTIEKSENNEKGGDNNDEQPEAALVDPVDRRETDATIREIIRSAAPEATSLSNSISEMRYQLPIAAASSFAPMFQSLDEAIQEGLICSYGVNITTLVSASHCLVWLLSLLTGTLSYVLTFHLVGRSVLGCGPR